MFRAYEAGQPVHITNSKGELLCISASIYRLILGPKSRLQDARAKVY